MSGGDGEESNTVIEIRFEIHGDLSVERGVSHDPYVEGGEGRS